MVSTTSILVVASAVALTNSYVDAHGYMEKPESEFTKKKTSEWIVQIDPQWKGDWDGAKGDDGLVALYKELKKSNNAKDIRTLLDSDTKLYGQNCGYTNPDVTPKDPPTDGTATFSRGIVHAGPCEIWLDDKMVLQNDDCQSAYGDGTKETISVFKPVDYSSCSSSGCMFRFYWLALQRRDSKTYWQAYKNCIPLTGPGTGGAGNSTTSGSSTSQTSPSSGESDSPSSGTSDSPSSGTSDSPSSGTSDFPSSGTSDSPSSGESDSPSSGTSDSPSSGESDSPSSGTSDSPSSGESDTPSTGTTPETPVSDGKCSVRRRRH